MDVSVVAPCLRTQHGILYMPLIRSPNALYTVSRLSGSLYPLIPHLRDPCSLSGFPEQYRAMAVDSRYLVFTFVTKDNLISV